MNDDADAVRAAALEAGRLLFAGPWRFVLGAATPAALPPTDGVEVAFAGRSNVGKSSLINAVTGRRALARTSRTPGQTRQLNVYDAGSPPAAAKAITSPKSKPKKSARPAGAKG